MDREYLEKELAEYKERLFDLKCGLEHMTKREQRQAGLDILTEPRIIKEIRETKKEIELIESILNEDEN